MKRIAVLTSGNDAPGMNACIRAVVRAAHYYNLEIAGIIRGYEGMIRNNFLDMDVRSVSNIIQKGGSILKCGGSDSFRTKEGRARAYDNLLENHIEGLIAIGGNGTFRGINKLFHEFGIPCIGIPATIDNALYGTDFTIGYDTAVNTALSAIDQLRDTADSHERVFFVEVMGGDTGYIAVKAGISGGAEMAIMPERKISLEEIVLNLKNLTIGNPSQIIVVAEENEGKKTKLIVDTVKAELPELDVRLSTLGHIQRGGEPSAADRVLASQLGLAAVEGLINGKANVMTGISNRILNYTPLEEVVEKEKPLDKDLLRMMAILNLEQTGSSDFTIN